MSKRLSYVLRHDPGSLGLCLDPAGWAEVDAFMEGLTAAGVRIGRERLEQLVAGSSEQRFELSADGRRIRARYGHSVPVDPGHEPAVPPDTLYHGTHPGAVAPILEQGLRPMGRRQVHLCPDVETAMKVGARRGRPVVLEVDAAAMHRAGHAFHRAGPTVWLTDVVPATFLRRSREVPRTSRDARRAGPLPRR